VCRIVVVSFLLVCLYLFCYDMTIFLRQVPSCEFLIPNQAVNNFIWLLSRSVSCYLWVFPIVYVFWPKLKKKTSRKKSEKKNVLMHSQSELEEE